MRTVRTVSELRAAVAGWRDEGQRVGLVPTMGAIHEGHLSLVDGLRRDCGRVAATIFVNPRQFGRNEDFSAYPRGEERDAALLAGRCTDLLYAPGVAEMYPDGFATTVRVDGLSEVLEGEHRPGHFEGVATVVAKLLLQALPDAAIFGEKDYQQLMVIRRFARDLDLPVDIRGGRTVREPDGLALSSRNAYLSEAERRVAPTMIRALQEAVAALAAGATGAAACAAAREALLVAGFGSVDYVALRDAQSLAPLDRPDRPARLLAAAWLGRTRLIDNISVPAPPEVCG